MSSKMKRLLAMVLTVCLVMGFMPVSSGAASEDSKSQIGKNAILDPETGGIQISNANETLRNDDKVSVTKSISAVSDLENVFDITLKVATQESSLFVPKGVDLVLVWDISSSMDDMMEPTAKDKYGKPKAPEPWDSDWNLYNTRWAQLKRAATEFITEFLESNPSNRITIVGFGGYTNSSDALASTQPVHHEIMGWTDYTQWMAGERRTVTVDNIQTKANKMDTAAYSVPQLAYESYYKYPVVNPVYVSKDFLTGYLKPADEYVTALTGQTALRTYLFEETPINTYGKYGGTNVHAGYVGAQAQLGKRGTISNLPYVIIMADGEANCYYHDKKGDFDTKNGTNGTAYEVKTGEENQFGYKFYGNTSSSNTSTAWQAARDQGLYMKREYKGTRIYAMSFGYNTTGWSAMNPKDNKALDGAYDAADLQDLAKAFKSIGDIITEAAKAWTVTDPMGKDIQFLQFLDGETNGPNTVATHGPVDGVDTINWNVAESSVEISNTTPKTYTYTLKYRVRLTNQIKGFTNEEFVLTNGVTSLTYYLNNDKTKQKNIDFSVPTVRGLLGSLTFNKVDEHGAPVSGATFTLTHASDCDCGTGADAIDHWSGNAISGKDGVVSFAGIPSGHKYILTETYDGGGIYVKNNKTYEITVSYGETDKESLKVNGDYQVENRHITPKIELVKTGDKNATDNMVNILGSVAERDSDTLVNYHVIVKNIGDTKLTDIKIYDEYLSYLPFDVKIDGIDTAVYVDNGGSYVLAPELPLDGQAILTYTVDLDKVRPDGAEATYDIGAAVHGETYTNTAVVIAKWPGQKAEEKDLTVKDTHKVKTVGEAEIHTAKYVGEFENINADGIPIGSDFTSQKRLTRLDGEGSAAIVPGNGEAYNNALAAYNTAKDALASFMNEFEAETGKTYEDYLIWLEALRGAKDDAQAEWNSSAIKAEWEVLAQAVTAANSAVKTAEANLEDAEAVLVTARNAQPRQQGMDESNEDYQFYLEQFPIDKQGTIATLEIARDSCAGALEAANGTFEVAQAALAEFVTGNPELELYQEAINLATAAYNAAYETYSNTIDEYNDLATAVNTALATLNETAKPDWSNVADSKFVLMYAMTVYNDGFTAEELTITDDFAFAGEPADFMYGLVAVVIDGNDYTGGVAALAEDLLDSDFDLSGTVFTSYDLAANSNEITLAPGQLLVIFAVADHYRDVTEGSFVNTLTVTAENDYTGAEIEEKTTEVTINSPLLAKLSVEKQVSKTGEEGTWKKHISIFEGEDAYFRIKVTNTSTVPGSFKLSDLLEGEAFDLYDVRNLKVEPTETITIAGGATLTFTAVANDELSIGYNLNKAVISTDDENTIITKDTDYAAVTVIELDPDVNLVKTAEDSVYTGETINYDLIAYITGNEAVTNLEIQDNMMMKANEGSFEVKYLAYGESSAADRAYTLVGSTLTIDGTFNPGDRIYISYTVTAPAVPGTVINEATLVTGEIEREAKAETEVVKPTADIQKKVQFGTIDNGSDTGIVWEDSISNQISARDSADVTYKLILTFANPLADSFTIKMTDALNEAGISLEGTQWYLNGEYVGDYNEGLTVTKSGTYVTYIHQSHSRGGYVNVVKITENDDVIITTPEDSATVNITNPSPVPYPELGGQPEPQPEPAPLPGTEPGTEPGGTEPGGTVEPQETTDPEEEITPPSDPSTSLPEDTEEVEGVEDIIIEDPLAQLPATGVLTTPVDPVWTLGALAVMASLVMTMLLGRRESEQD